MLTIADNGERADGFLDTWALLLKREVEGREGGRGVWGSSECCQFPDKLLVVFFFHANTNFVMTDGCTCHTK